jgi:hypothetical protein
MKRSNCIGLTAGILLALITSAPAWASLSQGFNASTSIAAGSLVALDAKSSNTVNVATLENAPRLFGVVVPASSASISLSGSSGAGQVQVATTGSANVFVTNAAGNIKVGDMLTVSQIAGVAEKVGDASTRVIGTAQADFDGTGSDVTKRTIPEGKSNHEVAISQIPVVISVSTYTSTSGKQPYVVPNWLQNLSNTLAGKAVAPIRVIVAALILLVALTCITVLLYSAVRNSIISIGRNPLSRGSVLRGLLEVMSISAGILGVAAGSIYFVIAR